MELFNYDAKSPESIITYSKQLYNKTLREVCKEEIEKHNFSGKGNFGQILEKFYFGYNPNSDSEADFVDAGIELKSSPLKELKNGQFQAKERLVLNIINYMNVHSENFGESSFWKKNAHLLLVFYLYEKDLNILDLTIRLVDGWQFPKEDLEIIKSDWLLIQQKIIDGKAHELSEGDTFYLGACTKGSTAEKSFREQPFNTKKAKQRAFSLKQGYVNNIIAKIADRNIELTNYAHEEQHRYGKRTKPKQRILKNPIEQFVDERFDHFIGKPSTELIDELEIKTPSSAIKQINALIVKAILGISPKEELEEFKKAEIEIKAIRVQTNNKIKESISFPAFQFTELYDDSWITSDFKERLEKKFLFVFFKEVNGEYFLEKVTFWNMPFEDRNECRKVWLKMKKVIQTGNIIKGYREQKDGKIVRLNNFPKKTESHVAHVRPHGKDATDTYPLPINELTTNENAYTKQCFWLNHDYIAKEIYLKA